MAGHSKPLGLVGQPFRPHISINRVLPNAGDPETSQIACLKDVPKMTKLTLASHPYLLGFDQLERLVEQTAKSGNEGYPPYNIEQSGDNSYRITLAVAGFAEDDLSITVEDRQLVIRGKQTDVSEGSVFLHRGIATRQFQRSFVLADGVDVAGAEMENGLLHVDLTRVVPDSVVQTIKIQTGSKPKQKIQTGGDTT